MAVVVVVGWKSVVVLLWGAVVQVRSGRWREVEKSRGGEAMFVAFFRCRVCVT